MKHLILFFMFSFFVVFSQNTYANTEQSINEYKIEQLQKSVDEIRKQIDELKKDVDDTKEKKLENKKDNESLDKRISDINGNVDRFGIIAGVLGLLITIGLVAIGFISYRNAKADAKEVAKAESEKITNNWLNNEVNQRLNEIITKLEDDAKVKIAEAVKTAKDEIKQQSEAEDLFLQGRSYYLNKEYEIAKDYYNKALQSGHKGALNNLGALYYKQNNYEKAEEYYNKALESGENIALNNLGILYQEQGKFNKAEEYYNKALEIEDNRALNNLGTLYQKQGKFNEAEEYFLKAIESCGDSKEALINLEILYKEQNEHTKLEKLKQKYKI